MRVLTFLCLLLITFGCKEATTTTEKKDNTDISDISTKDFREFKVLDSKYLSNAQIWRDLNVQIEDFTEERYNALKPLVLEQDIPTLQQYISEGKLSYENLTKFYLYRIRAFDRENDLSLNSVIAINPNIISEAKAKDEALRNMDIAIEDLKYSVYGMPILLKDNINALGMPTTAGAVALQNNNTNDAFIVTKLKEQGALILGKANLSEWAYFFCGDCPSGYSAIGGQTLNPYGRKTIDTGGSSSGSGVAVAANFCVAAVGSETSGSILSPASQNSVVGLKPEVGLVSRSGIIPISSTLDTAGPIAKNVTDTAILLGAMYGYDPEDSKSFESVNTKWTPRDFSRFEGKSLKNKTFGAFKPLLKDSLYLEAISVLKAQGAEIVEFEPEDYQLPDFLRLLNLDMKKDLPDYFSKYADPTLNLKSVDDVITFNTKDSANVMPYGQKLFRGVVADTATEEEFKNIKKILKNNGSMYFDIVMKRHNLDAFLSINNYHAGFAAVAENPAITVPMGYTENGVPKGLTFIGKEEKMLLDFAYLYEQVSKKRQAPKDYN
ncbi:amidase family protein [Olleya sp. YS]|uniref:amidase family protein n=1 Tax=Olleya sp. YS TaxID=3028318 RepID=UPI00243412B2|nr:amidase family protein [Olleya sp. YS]WGD34036.1 amidase family protein [Olleya sp. YS]